MTGLVQRPGLWRMAFWIYAPILFTLTHTPGITLPTRYRPDLLVHFGAFGMWAGLLAMAAYFGPTLSWRNIRIVWPIAACYAAIDEGLQAIPFIHRHAAVDDWLANVGGITIVGISLLTFGSRSRRAGRGDSGQSGEGQDR